MARIRTVKPELWSDKKLPNISRTAHLTWIGIWNFSDDRGVIEADPLLIKSNVYPRRLDVSVEDIAKEINELLINEYLVQFTYEGDEYYLTRTFCDHQKIDRPRPSKIPAEQIARVLDEYSTKPREKSALYCIVKEGTSIGTGEDSISSKELTGGEPPAARSLEPLYKKIAVKDKQNVIRFIRDHKPEFIEPFYDLWNLFALSNKMPVMKTISKSRRQKFNVRIKERQFDFEAILKKAKDSEFIRTSSWFSFDWLIVNDKNYLKLLEGNYDAKAPDGKPAAAAGSAPKGFQAELKYLVERFQEPDFDQRAVTTDVYDLLVSRSYLQPNTLQQYTAETIDQQKILAVLAWLKQTTTQL